MDSNTRVRENMNTLVDANLLKEFEETPRGTKDPVPRANMMSYHYSLSVFLSAIHIT